MNKKTKNILLIVGVGVVAYLIWKANKGQKVGSKETNEPKLSAAGGEIPRGCWLPRRSENGNLYCGEIGNTAPLTLINGVYYCCQDKPVGIE